MIYSKNGKVSDVIMKFLYLKLRETIIILKNKIEKKIRKKSGRKLYYFSLIILFLCMLFCLSLYLIIENDKISNIFGNAFAGFLTGLIVSFISNIKNKEVQFYNDKIERYTDFSKNIKKINRTMTTYYNKSGYNISELSCIFSDIVNFLDECNSVFHDNWYIELEKKFDIYSFTESLHQEYRELMQTPPIYRLTPEEYANELSLCNRIFTDMQMRLNSEILDLLDEKIKLEEGIL